MRAPGRRVTFVGNRCRLPTPNSPSTGPVWSGNANVWIAADSQPLGAADSRRKRGNRQTISPKVPRHPRSHLRHLQSAASPDPPTNPSPLPTPICSGRLRPLRLDHSVVGFAGPTELSFQFPSNICETCRTRVSPSKGFVSTGMFPPTVSRRTLS